MSTARALLSWDQERRLLRHEMSSGLYSLTPFLIGTKLLVSLPLEVAVVAGSGALLYLLVGLQAVAAKFWIFMAMSVFLAVCAANLGNAICLVMTDMHFKLPALCITATLLLAFAGFVGEFSRASGAARGYCIVALPWLQPVYALCPAPVPCSGYAATYR